MAEPLVRMCPPPAEPRELPQPAGRPRSSRPAGTARGRPPPSPRPADGAGGSAGREVAGLSSRPAAGVFPAAGRSPGRRSGMRWLGRIRVPSVAFVGHRSGCDRGGKQPVPSSSFSSRSSWWGPRGGSRPYGCVVPPGARATRGVHHTLLCCCRLTSDSSNGAITFEKLIKRRTQPVACHPRGDPSRRVSSVGAGTRGIARGGARRGWPSLPRGRFFQLSRRRHGNLGVGWLSLAPPIGGAAVCSGSRSAEQGCSGPGAPRGASVQLPAAGGAAGARRPRRGDVEPIRLTTIDAELQLAAPAARERGPLSNVVARWEADSLVVWCFVFE